MEPTPLDPGPAAAQKAERDDAAAIGDLLGRMHFVPTVRLGALWTAAAGALIAQHTRVVGRTDTGLRIGGGEGWLAQIEPLQDELVERLQALGLTWVQRLILEPRNLEDPRVVHQQRPDVPAEARHEAAAAVAEVRSPAVRSALERLLLQEARARGPEARPGAADAAAPSNPERVP